MNCWAWVGGRLKGLGGLGTGGAIYGAMAIRVTRNVERERSFPLSRCHCRVGR